MKLNDPKTTGKCCPECKTNFRVKTSTNMDNEIIKVWTCPHCFFRITKVNVAATKRNKLCH